MTLQQVEAKEKNFLAIEKRAKAGDKKAANAYFFIALWKKIKSDKRVLDKEGLYNWLSKKVNLSIKVTKHGLRAKN